MADLLPAGLAGAMIFLAILVNLTPNLLFFRIHGTIPKSHTDRPRRRMHME